ncbi:hypothetical protein [Brachybacterium sp. AOP35-5H-19]|uniref:hypothetical protein n=1 Tax=Brachybacterium sp. AOP35-5H-19 TaxID=3457685 RepID=UPI003FB916D0
MPRTRPRNAVGFTTRSLLICVVLGAATAVLIHLARFVGVLLFGAAPWLGKPSALIPYFVLLIVASLLVPRFGSALIASLVGTVVGIGTMALMAGLMVEVGFAIARSVQRRTSGELAPFGDRRWLVWAMLAGCLVGLNSFALLFTFKEFQALPAGLMLAGLGVRIVAGIAYGWLAWVTVRGLLSAGLKLDGPSRRSVPAPSSSGSAS